eukprot:TRINITY_DN8455_c0_g1_i3.p1 TRINITY_DN8455_c0_g1~~TRINITY_DN8455_c0_g1_i3.p1  ORF type:complete len:216 (+),score=43.78 TRINITY_DN8455_c0_g1_i3:113-760(+)
MIRRPPRSTQGVSSAASDVYKRQVDNICGKTNSFRYDLIPGCIFTAPEIGSVGLSEAQCKEQGIEYNIGKFPFAALGKAMAINETDGFVKIIADKQTDQVLGVHIIGPHATDLISEAVPAMNLEITATELGKAVHAHPTLGEAMMEAAHAVHGECAHMPAPRKKHKQLLYLNAVFRHEKRHFCIYFTKGLDIFVKQSILMAVNNYDYSGFIKCQD